MRISGNSIEMSVKIHGTHGPWIVLAHSLGCTKEMWSAQLEALSGYRVLTYDLRGHGASGIDGTEGTIDLLRRDLEALLDALEIDRVHYVGISIGGMIGQALALKSPERVISLTLANTSNVMPLAARHVWLDRITQARDHGVATLAEGSLKRWLPADFVTVNPDIYQLLHDEFCRTSVEGFVACCNAIMHLDFGAEIARIKRPTLLIAGSQDLGSSAEKMREMHDLIPGSQFELIEGAGHLSCVDHPGTFNRHLSTFITKLGANV